MRALPTHFNLIEYARLDGPDNMALDRDLLTRCEKFPECGFLRFYTWEAPTLSMGHLEPQDAVDIAAAERDGVAIVRRPTGGRMVLHGDDLTYTVVMAKPHGAGLQATYDLISEILVCGLSSMGADLDIERGTPGRSRVTRKPCFASVSRHEVTCRGRKVVGSAQRVGDRAVLQHGSIPLGTGYLNVVDYIKVSSADRERLRNEMETGTSCLSQVLARHVAPEEVAEALTAAFRVRFQCGFEKIPLGKSGVDHCRACGVKNGAHTCANPSDKSP